MGTNKIAFRWSQIQTCIDRQKSDTQREVENSNPQGEVFLFIFLNKTSVLVVTLNLSLMHSNWHKKVCGTWEVGPCWWKWVTGAGLEDGKPSPTHFLFSFCFQNSSAAGPAAYWSCVMPFQPWWVVIFPWTVGKINLSFLDLLLVGYFVTATRKLHNPID